MDLKEKILELLDSENIAQAEKLLLSASDSLGPWADFCRGEIFRMRGFFNKASSCYMKFLSSRPCGEEKLSCLLKLAACSRTMGLKSKALFYSKKALKEAPESEEAILEAAMALRLAGKRNQAQSLFYSLIRIYSSSKDWAGLSYVWWAMGGLKRNYGELAAAVSCFEKSFSFAVKAKDRSLKVYALFGLAGALRIKGEIERSAATYRKAASYASADDVFARAYSFCGLANALRQKGDLKKSFALYKRSGRLYSAMGDKPDLGFVNWGMGEILKKQGNFKAAVSNFRKAYILFKAGLEKRGEILSLFSMAQSLYALGRIKQADKMYFSALKEARKEKFKTYLEIFT